MKTLGRGFRCFLFNAPETSFIFVISHLKFFSSGWYIHKQQCENLDQKVISDLASKNVRREVFVTSKQVAFYVILFLV